MNLLICTFVHSFVFWGFLKAPCNIVYTTIIIYSSSCTLCVLLILYYVQMIIN